MAARKTTTPSGSGAAEAESTAGGRVVIDEVALGDPADVDFIDHLADAIRGLAALGHPSTSRDRSRIRAERNLPRPVFSYLAKRGLIRATEGRDSPRELVPEVETLARDPDKMLSFLWDRVGTGRGGRRQPAAYINAIHKVMHTWGSDAGLVVDSEERGHILASSRDWKSILWEPLRDDADAWIAHGDRHKWLHHMRSSQSFAVNLFGPLKLEMPWARDVWAAHFPDVTTVGFEYPQQGDPLKETTAERRTRTRADVRLDASGGYTWIVEVKLTEPEFGPCSAGHDPKNPLRALSCEAASAPLDALRDNCHLHRLGRNYFPLLEASDSLVDLSKLLALGKRGCPLRNDLYQVVRNLLLVQHVRSTESRRARFAVVAPGRDLNPTLHEAGGSEPILERFLRSILKDTEQASLSVIDFAGVVEVASRSSDMGATGWAAFMRQRYLLALSAGQEATRNLNVSPTQRLDRGE